MTEVLASAVGEIKEGVDDLLHLRFLEPLGSLAAAFGEDGFGQKAEAFARFFGTPKFLIGQTLVVAAWIAVNAVAVSLRWDAYPFILLNLVFSTQAAYAAPLILLAQTRQADREKALAEADAKHREALALASIERQEIAASQGEQLRALLESNTALTEQNTRLTEQLHQLTREIHGTGCAESH
jgi:uncharacterized membrane protein